LMDDKFLASAVAKLKTDALSPPLAAVPASSASKATPSITQNSGNRASAGLCV
jgi:hypothetical protein